MCYIFAINCKKRTRMSKSRVGHSLSVLAEISFRWKWVLLAPANHLGFEAKVWKPLWWHIRAIMMTFLILLNATENKRHLIENSWLLFVTPPAAVTINFTFLSSVSGKPKGLKNCTAVNQTFESLSIICLAGEAFVTDQRFILEVNYINQCSMVPKFRWFIANF